MGDQRDFVADAFDRKAEVYDSFGEEHPVLERMRSKVRLHVQSLLPEGGRILELNAGTGLDAAWLALHGYTVHATDLSPAMIAKIEEKIGLYRLETRLTAQRLAFNRLEILQPGSYDLALSNMGGLNCTPDLKAIASQMAHVLRPGGYVVWVIMPRICPWEMLSASLRGDFRTARRRLSRGGTLANVEGVTITTYYHSPSEVKYAFGPSFTPVKLEGLSVFTPPADHKGFAGRHARAYRLLVWLDDRLAAHRPFSGWGDFFIYTLQYGNR